MKRRAFLATVCGAVAASSGCTSSGSSQGTEGNESRGDESVRTESPTLTFDVPGIDAHHIQTHLTCDGANVSPHLVVVETAASIQSLALVMDNPDAGPRPFVHWTLWDLKPTVAEVPGNLANEARVTLEEVETDGQPPAVSQGTNSSGTIGYTGPCPQGETQLYRFTMYGLTEPLGVEPGADPATVREALGETVVSRTTLTGLYGGESSG